MIGGSVPISTRVKMQPGQRYNKTIISIFKKTILGVTDAYNNIFKRNKFFKTNFLREQIISKFFDRYDLSLNFSF